MIKEDTYSRWPFLGASFSARVSKQSWWKHSLFLLCIVWWAQRHITLVLQRACRPSPRRQCNQAGWNRLLLRCDKWGSQHTSSWHQNHQLWIAHGGMAAWWTTRTETPTSRWASRPSPSWSRPRGRTEVTKRLRCQLTIDKTRQICSLLRSTLRLTPRLGKEKT